MGHGYVCPNVGGDGLLDRLFLVDASAFRAPGIHAERAARNDSAN